jgi:ABC-type Na+ efflux pump permease subunit
MGLVLVLGIPFGVSSPRHAVFWILFGALIAVLLPYLAVFAWLHSEIWKARREGRSFPL